MKICQKPTFQTKPSKNHKLPNFWLERKLQKRLSVTQSLRNQKRNGKKGKIMFKMKMSTLMVC